MRNPPAFQPTLARTVQALLGAAMFCVLLSPAPGHSQESGGGGVNSGGGGEALEIPFYEIRNDILKWLSEADPVWGPEDLELPAGVRFEDYRDAMAKYLAPEAVLVAFVTEEERKASPGDPELSVGNFECKNLISKRPATLGKPKIICSSLFYEYSNVFSWYERIHHQYAALAGLERDVGKRSSLFYSQQVPEYLSLQPEPRLSTRRVQLKSKKESKASPADRSRGVEIGAGYQRMIGEGSRVLLRVSYLGKRRYEYLQERTLYAFSAQGAAGISGQNALPQLALRFTPYDKAYFRYGYNGEVSVLPVVASREVALGNAGKLRIDLLKAGFYASTESPKRPDEMPSPGHGEFYINAAASALGAQLLLASQPGHGAPESFLRGLDVGEVELEAGFAHMFEIGFSTKISVGGKTDLGVVREKPGGAFRLANERALFGTLALQLEHEVRALEAYFRGDAGQLQLGHSDPASFVSIQVGAAGKF